MVQKCDHGNERVNSTVVGWLRAKKWANAANLLQMTPLGTNVPWGIWKICIQRDNSLSP